MILKEKAKELVDKFRKHVDCDLSGEDGFEYSKDAETYNAKQCALIAVDEVLNNYYKNHFQNGKKIDFWLDVRLEIKKI